MLQLLLWGGDGLKGGGRLREEGGEERGLVLRREGREKVKGRGRGDGRRGRRDGRREAFIYQPITIF